MDKIDLDTIMLANKLGFIADNSKELVRMCMKEAIHQALVLGSSEIVEELTSSTDLNVGQITNAAKIVLNIEKLIV